MKHIVLTQEKIALVSDRDLSFIKSYGYWCAFKQRNGDFYAVHVTARPNRKMLYMHRLIRPGVEKIDYRNHNGLDNRRSNLRPCTSSQNAYNSSRRMNNTSGFKGVNWHAGKWQARIRVNKIRIDLGRFDSPHAAGQAYAQAALKFHKHFAHPDMRGLSCL